MLVFSWFFCFRFSIQGLLISRRVILLSSLSTTLASIRFHLTSVLSASRGTSQNALALYGILALELSEVLERSFLYKLEIVKNLKEEDLQNSIVSRQVFALRKRSTSGNHVCHSFLAYPAYPAFHIRCGDCTCLILMVHLVGCSRLYSSKTPATV